MTRSEAVDIQYKTGLSRHPGIVRYRSREVKLLSLNYPHHRVQMARVEVDGKTEWVKLEELSDGHG